MKQEIEFVVGSSVGSKGSVTRPGQASSSSGPQPMDVDSITQWIASLVKGRAKGKGKGKSKGKEKGKGKGKDSSKGSNGSNPNRDKDIVCHNCSKKGHRQADCWSKKKDGKGNQKGNSKGNQKGKKHVSGLENGESAEAGAEPAPEADVGLFDDVGAIDGKVCTPATASAVEEWVRFNLDTGAVQTAVPKDWVNDKVTVTGSSEVIFKTASGELVPSEGTGTFVGFGERGMRCRVRGAIADVHKPLVSAHKCLGFGRIAVLENGGQLVP